MGNPVVDVIVPVYRPDDKFYKLLQQLKQQTWPVHRIILMNTEKKFWDEFWKTREGLNMENLEVHHIPMLSLPRTAHGQRFSDFRRTFWISQCFPCRYANLSFFKILSCLL